MSKIKRANYSINLSFSPIKLPPVTDILVLAKKYPQGKVGVSEAFKLIAPDEFEMISIDDGDDEVIDAVLINKRIMKKLSQEKIMKTLKETVFPYVSKGEAVNVDFHVTLEFNNIKGES